MRGRIAPHWRRLFVAATLMVGTLGAGVGPLTSPGVYISQVDLVFVFPSGADTVNLWDGSSDALTTFAGIVAKAVYSDESATMPVTDGVTLADQGITRGWVVRQPNRGGQWAYNFQDPMLNVQVVGPSALEVNEELAVVRSRVERSVRSLEEAAGVTTENQIRIVQSPGRSQVHFENGSRRRALAGLLALGVVLSILGARMSDWWAGDPDDSQFREVPAKPS